MAMARLTGGQLKFLSDDQIRQVHGAVLRVMQEVGVRMAHEPALKVMADAGCHVDFDKRIVRTPEHVLNRALADAPSQFTLHGQRAEHDLVVNTDNIYTIGGSSALFVLDLEGRRHPATLEDLIDLTRLQDGLANLHVMHGIVNPQDIPQPGFDRILYANVVPNTTRNYYSQGTGAKSIRDQVDMAAVQLGSSEEFARRPNFTIVVCMISPLLQPAMRLEELMACAELGVPVYVEVDAQLGGTGPVTIAGTLVEQCANVLTGIVLAQVLRPGLPCIFAIASGSFDMSTGNYSGGSPEAAVLHAATAQMARFYDLPFQGGTGIDATIPDAQAGYERALQVLTNALAGTNFIHLSIGMIEQMLLASYEQCVIDDEILGAAFHIAKGLEVSGETLAVDAIKEVGPGGQFLDHPHTLRHFRQVNWFAKLTCRQKWDNWQASGGKSMRERAGERARHILDTHRPRHLSEDQAREIHRIARTAQQQAIREQEHTVAG